MSTSAPVCSISTGLRRTGVPAEVHAMLVLWGSWRARTANSGPAGYPRQSPFVKSALYGKLGIPQESNVRVEPESDPMAEKIEGIVTTMPDELADALVLRYSAAIDPNPKERLEDYWVRLSGVSRSTFRGRLENAQWYVFGRLY